MNKLLIGVLAAFQLILPLRLEGQSWDDVRTRDLVSRATQRRAEVLSDSGLAGYTARAHGYLTFLAQLGEGFLLPPKVIKADELELEVYWQAPNSSKQWIVGRRDTLLLPTDIQYHRDHLGIVQNNFPSIIRLGDGDEVRDVPHPLSQEGLAVYQYRISDSLRVDVPGRTISVYEVKVRPRVDSIAAAVGALYISKDDAQVVRMAFSFTRSALKDEQLEDVSIILENSLILERFWLPRRQEIEIRRSGSWMDFPARGIIRGRWEISNYDVNTAAAATARAPGAEIVLAPPAKRAAFRFPNVPIVQGLPDDVRLATDDDVRQVQDEARALVREQALRRPKGLQPSAMGVSDVVRVTRAEGVALGAGMRRALGNGFEVKVSGRFGFADHEPKMSLGIGKEWPSGGTLRAELFREYREAGDLPEASRVSSSISAQEFGADRSDPYDARGGRLSMRLPTQGSIRAQFDLAVERRDSVRVSASPALGRYEATLPVQHSRAFSVAAVLSRAPLATRFAREFRWHMSARGVEVMRDGVTRARVGRIFGSAAASGFTFAPRLGISVLGGLAVANHGPIPIEELFLVGGPQSLPGYGFHQFAATRFASVRVEHEFRAPFPRIPLGSWGSVPSGLSIAPFVGGAAISTDADGQVRTRPFAGVALRPFFGLLNVEIGRGLRGPGGRWRLAIDVPRDFWSIL